MVNRGVCPFQFDHFKIFKQILVKYFCKYWKRRSIQDLHENRGTGTVQKFAVQFVHCVLDGSGLSFSNERRSIIINVYFSCQITKLRHNKRTIIIND